MKPAWSRGVLIALVLAACHKNDSLGTMAVGTAPSPKFDEAWRALETRGALGGEVFYVEDDRGEGLMGRVRRAGKAVPKPAPTLEGEAPVPAPAPSEGPPELPSGEDVSQIVRSNLPAVKTCYLRFSRETGRSVSGRAIVSFTVNKEGAVDDVLVDAPAFVETDLPTCVSQQVKRWSFPKSKKGGLAVSYPFVFVGG